MDIPHSSSLLAQIQFRERTGSNCVAENGFCPDWIRHNIGKYWSPLLEHIFLTVVSVGIGFAIAFALALIAHRRRWLTGPIVGVTGAMYTIPSVALFAILIPLTGFGFKT